MGLELHNIGIGSASGVKEKGLELYHIVIGSASRVKEIGV